ncbi:MAG: TetR/AcrR family transcriptional regulator, partial [Candidatus Marinimicrobia bacterium]|nr:TetR/AcrR family transcriptional regulator [Candidatus Neomarinimicrobiota bacterium]
MRYSGEERRKQIVDESINIIYEQSFLQFTIRELAQRVGLSEAGIYRHFDSKDDIIMQILERMNDFGKEIAQKIGQTNNPIEKIKQFFLLQLE